MALIPIIVQDAVQGPTKLARESRYADVDWLSEQDVKAFLREMVLVREHVRETLAAHHLHGDAVRQAIYLIGARSVQRQSLQKPRAGNLDDAYVDIIEQPLNERHRFGTQVRPRSAQCSQQLRKDGIGSKDDILVCESVTQSGNVGMPWVPPIEKRDPVEGI